MTMVREMNHRQAVRIAVAAMQRELRVIAFDAQVHDQLGARYSQAVMASKRSAELKAAIAVLKKENVPQPAGVDPGTSEAAQGKV
jgi:hypothetical protein